MGDLVRITKVGGRYIVFEVKDVASLRRDHCICAVLVGTTPQNPTQNLFSGLPLELLPEEAKLLVDKGAAYVVDDATSHLTRLTSMDPTAKHAYLQSLRTRRQNISRVLDEEDAIRKAEDLKAYSVPVEAPGSYPFYKHLNSKGYYITPGIRFGADYSVYPGDPFRYHAHFMATSFEWDEEITLLDLVSGGRLGTGVKKGFLIGGQAPSEEAAGKPEDAGEDRVRTFTLEWAAM
ncbi:putative trna-splicing endonuclease subunit sen34 [Diaporthe ampelina]|uniref:tRNA-intron lyase n=1 Tax=Diaporthe ampelina TaxID=1214573 RepID=A0A0G2HV87_9PEZI|nr:putative trna-splicing endonuclease subunit sen34 [Diaporthe ampelina]